MDVLVVYAEGYNPAHVTPEESEPEIVVRPPVSEPPRSEARPTASTGQASVPSVQVDSEPPLVYATEVVAEPIHPGTVYNGGKPYDNYQSHGHAPVPPGSSATQNQSGSIAPTVTQYTIPATASNAPQASPTTGITQSGTIVGPGSNQMVSHGNLGR